MIRFTVEGLDGASIYAQPYQPAEEEPCLLLAAGYNGVPPQGPWARLSAAEVLELQAQLGTWLGQNVPAGTTPPMIDTAPLNVKDGALQVAVESPQGIVAFLLALRLKEHDAASLAMYLDVVTSPYLAATPGQVDQLIEHLHRHLEPVRETVNLAVAENLVGAVREMHAKRGMVSTCPGCSTRIALAGLCGAHGLCALCHDEDGLTPRPRDHARQEPDEPADREQPAGR